MNRRGFLQLILATATMPAIVRASSLMPGRGVLIPTKEIILPGAMRLWIPTALIQAGISTRGLAKEWFNGRMFVGVPEGHRAYGQGLVGPSLTDSEFRGLGTLSAGRYALWSDRTGLSWHQWEDDGPQP